MQIYMQIYIYIYTHIIYYGNINKDTITLNYSSLLLYCDPQLLHTHTLLISSRFGRGGATSSQLRLVIHYTILSLQDGKILTILYADFPPCVLQKWIKV